MNQSNETFSMNDFLIRVARKRRLCPELRNGQANFAILYEMRPEWADKITATKFDPFYCDERLDDFYKWLFCKIEGEKDET